MHSGWYRFGSVDFCQFWTKQNQLVFPKLQPTHSNRLLRCSISSVVRSVLSLADLVKTYEMGFSRHERTQKNPIPVMARHRNHKLLLLSGYVGFPLQTNFGSRFKRKQCVGCMFVRERERYGRQGNKMRNGFICWWREQRRWGGAKYLF